MPKKGKFSFPGQSFISNNAGPEETKSVIDTVSAAWNCYLNRDAKGYTARLTRDVTRLSQRSGLIQQGTEAVAAGLSAEWSAFERAEETIAEQMTVRQAELQAEKSSSPTFAAVLYWVEIRGGGRWKYSDQGLVFQVLTCRNGEWQIAHQTDSWSLDYNLDARQPGDSPGFEFNFVYPVKDLTRAVNFYKPLLGEPEAVSNGRASFNLRGERFILDTLDFGGHVRVEKDMPNGYALFYVKDIAAEYERLKRQGLRWAGPVQNCRGDRYAAGFDPSQNLFLLWEKNFCSQTRDSFPAPTGFNDKQPFVQSARNIASAWLKGDAADLTRYYGSRGRWFDDSRIKTRGLEHGQSGISAALNKVYWTCYDRTAQGHLAAEMEVRQVRVRPLGAGALVSYEMQLSGLGTHPFRDRALVTHLFHSPTEVSHTFICAADSSGSMALELDYTGYPAVDLNQSRRFYKQITGSAEGYSDEDYYGYWGNNVVFGLYTADPEKDGLPRPGQSNGYMSFWIRSAEQTLAYLKRQGCSFPLIPAINDRRGIDDEPGYRQIAATDSEGNVILFTEYTGRIK